MSLPDFKVPLTQILKPLQELGEFLSVSAPLTLDSANTSIPLITSADIGLTIRNENATASNLDGLAFANANGYQAVIAAVNIGSGALAGADLVIATRAAGASTLAEAARFTSEKDFGLGIALPLSKAHIVGNGLYIDPNGSFTANSVSQSNASYRSMLLAWGNPASITCGGSFQVRQNISPLTDGWMALHTSIDNLNGRDDLWGANFNAQQVTGGTNGHLRGVEINVQGLQATSTDPFGAAKRANGLEIFGIDYGATPCYLASYMGTWHPRTDGNGWGYHGVYVSRAKQFAFTAEMRGDDAVTPFAGAILYANSPSPSIILAGARAFTTAFDLSAATMTNAFLSPSFKVTGTGNLGVGVTSLQSWDVGQAAIQFGGIGSLIAERAASAGSSFNLSCNAALVSGAWQRIVSAEASNYYQLSGTHNWRVAATSTAGSAITWLNTTAMKLDVNNNFTIGNPTLGTSAVKNFVLATGATAPTNWTSLPSGLHCFVQEETPNAISSGSHAHLWAKGGVSIRSHVAIGDFPTLDASYNSGVDAGILTSYKPLIALNVYLKCTGDFSATGLDAVTGVSIAKRQGASFYVESLADVGKGLKLSDEIYGSRSIIWDKTNSATHLGLIYGAAGEFVQGGTARVNRGRGLIGTYALQAAADAGDARGVFGFLSIGTAGTGTMDVADAVIGEYDVNGGPITITQANVVRGRLSVTSGVTFTSPDVRLIRASGLNVSGATLVLDKLAGVSIADTSGFAGVTNAFNIDSEGVNSQNAFAGAGLFGGKPLEADTLPQFGLIQGQSAYGLASTSVTGGDVALTGGFGRRLFTVVNIGLGNTIVTITVNGTAVTLEGSTTGSGVDFAYGATTTTAATALAAKINATASLNTKVLAIAISANVYLRRRGSLYSLTIATNQSLRISVTSGTDGAIRFPNAGTSAAPAVLFSATGLFPGFYVKTQGGVDQITAVAGGVDSAFMVQNLNASGYSGISYLDNAGTVQVFTGYANATGEFIFNNIASTPSINFKISSSSLFKMNATGIGAFGATPVAKPTVTGSRGGNAALASLLTGLASLGWVTDSTTA